MASKPQRAPGCYIVTIYLQTTIHVQCVYDLSVYIISHALLNKQTTTEMLFLKPDLIKKLYITPIPYFVLFINNFLNIFL